MASTGGGDGNRCVVFSVDELPPHGVHEYQPCTLVALSVRSYALTQTSSWRDLVWVAPASYSDQISLRVELQQLWKRCLAQLGPDAEYHRWEFSWIFSNLLFWRQTIRNALSELQPTTVVIPEHPSLSDDRIECFEEFFIWLAHRVLSEETRDHAPTFHRYRPPGSSPEGPSVVAPSVRLGFGELVRWIRLWKEWGRKALQWSRKCVGAQWLGARSQSGVVVVAQKGKVAALLAAAPRRLVDYMTYEEFDREIASGGQSILHLQLPSGTSSTDGAWKALAALISTRRRASASVQKFISRGWRALITDAQHDPRIREIIAEGAVQGKKIAVVPEGAVSYSGRWKDFAGTLVFAEHPDLTRFVLSAADARSWSSDKSAQTRVTVSGYLGDTKPEGKVRTYLYSGWIRRLRDQVTTDEEQVVALLSLDSFFTPFEVPRLGMIGESEILEHSTQILDALTSDNIVVFAKGRDPRILGILEQRFAGKPVIWTSTLPWNRLVSFSDVTVVRDSSIGWESLTLRKPVVVWNFSDLPSLGETTLEGMHPDWVRFATSPALVAHDVRQLADAHRNWSEERLTASYSQLPLAQSDPSAVLSWLSEYV